MARNKIGVRPLREKEKEDKLISVSEERSLLEEGCQEESKRPTRVSSEKRFIYNINYYRSKPKAKCIDRFPCVGREIE